MARSSPHLIRMLTVDDAAAWAALRFEALVAHPLAFGSSAPETSDDLVEVARERLAASDEAAVLGAFVEGGLVGVVGIRRQPGLKERHKGLLWGMYVSAGSRRRGIAASLVDAALEHARRWVGVAQVHLAVSETAVEARAMYEQLGFRAWGREPRALCVDGRFVDEHHMVLMLDEAAAPVARRFVVHVSVAVEREGRLLMVTESKPDVRGMLNLPGGRLEHGEGLVDAARREALEETGLRVTITGIVGLFTAVSDQGNHVFRFVFAADAGTQIAAAGDDVTAVSWHSVDELVAMDDARLAGASMLRGILARIARHDSSKLSLLDDTRNG